jgi:hypothetical protein
VQAVLVAVELAVETMAHLLVLEQQILVVAVVVQQDLLMALLQVLVAQAL